MDISCPIPSLRWGAPQRESRPVRRPGYFLAADFTAQVADFQLLAKRSEVKRPWKRKHSDYPLCWPQHLPSVQKSFLWKSGTVHNVVQKSWREVLKWNFWQCGRSRARKKLGRGESQKGEEKRWRNTVFPMFCGSWWSKSRLTKAAVAEVGS